MGNQPSQQPPKRNMKKPVMRRPTQQFPAQLPVFQAPPQMPPPPPEQIFAYPQNLVTPPSRDLGVLMVRPESTKIVPNLMNVNDKIEQFKREQKQEESSFLQNLEKAKEQFYKKQKTKEEYFQDELKEFEKTVVTDSFPCPPGTFGSSSVLFSNGCNFGQSLARHW